MSKTSAPRGVCMRVLGMTVYLRRANGNRAHSLPAARGIPNLTACRPVFRTRRGPAGGVLSGLLLGQALAQLGQDDLGDQPADVPAVPGDLLHQAGTQERVER